MKYQQKYLPELETVDLVSDDEVNNNTIFDNKSSCAFGPQLPLLFKWVCEIFSYAFLPPAQTFWGDVCPDGY